MEKIERILVVIDMQNDFVTGSLGTAEAKNIVSSVVSKYKKYMKDPDAYIIFTQDTHDNNYLDTAEGKKLPTEHCIRDTDGWKIIPEFRKINNNPEKIMIFTKETFGSNVLGTYIKGIVAKAYKDDYETYDQFMNDIMPKIEIDIVGVCTNICVISNALILKSIFPENKITVDTKCCAGTTPEAHEAAIKIMESCLIEIIK